MATRSTTTKGARKPRTTGAKSPRKGKAAGAAGAGEGSESGSARGKQLVIVESPAKAKTINKYLGPGFVVKASVGHVRDLPSKNPKGVKNPVPGVDLKHDFAPSYEVLPGKGKVVQELQRAARGASEVWFATDLDREGEAIAWHLAHLLGVDPAHAKRVVFNAITKGEIERAFGHPHQIDEGKVNAQQARRVLDRIVGYQVSPLLWKKVGRGLSAGRVQSVAVRLIVEREREIRSFVPDERWSITARFAVDPSKAPGLAKAWASFIGTVDEKGAGPTVKGQNAWLASHEAIKGELVEVAGERFETGQAGMIDGAAAPGEPKDLTKSVVGLAELAGLKNIRTEVEVAEKGRGPAQFVRTITGEADPSVAWRVDSIETRRTSSRAPAPFITSTLQQAASSRLGFGAQRTMRAAQQLYEGVEIPGEGAVGLITYMRTDSTHISGDALEMARGYIQRTYGAKYLPEKPNFFSSSNKGAQEAHEAIRPTSMDNPPSRVKNALKPDQLRLYTLIWERFVACQMTPAQWDATAVTIKGGKDPKRELAFRSTGRTLVFDGFYRVAGVPTASDEQTLPALAERQKLGAFSIEPEQSFSSPPPRYSEASLIKMLESEGIGRPSTYASIIGVIQDRKYAEQVDRRFYATDLGEVVTDKLIEAFPQIMEVGYTRDLEKELDQIEDEHIDWVQVLKRFYGPFTKQLEIAHATLTHAKAEIQPAPKEYRCEKCRSDLVYRFGKNGRFLSCSTYPKCDYACPCDREGKPMPIETADVACPDCGRGMIKRTGRFGVFFGCSGYPECKGILKADKQGRPVAPSVPAMQTDLPCASCGGTLVLRSGARGPWLSCGKYPKCRGRGKWTEVPEEKRAELEKALAAHEKAHPIPIIRDLAGHAITDAKGKPIERAQADMPATEPSIEDLDVAAA